MWQAIRRNFLAIRVGCIVAKRGVGGLWSSPAEEPRAMRWIPKNLFCIRLQQWPGQVPMCTQDTHAAAQTPGCSLAIAPHSLSLAPCLLGRCAHHSSHRHIRDRARAATGAAPTLRAVSTFPKHSTARAGLLWAHTGQSLPEELPPGRSSCRGVGGLGPASLLCSTMGSRRELGF